MSEARKDDRHAPVAKPLANVMENRIVRRAHHRPDWSVSDAWTALDPRYRRALIRCIDPVGKPRPSHDHVVPAEHFTLFMEVFPPGCEGGLHQHPDGEEVYVVLEGDGVRLKFQDGEDTYETRLGKHDVASVPPGMFRVVCNDGPGDALVLVVFGSGHPEKATLAPHHPMAEVPR